MPNNESSILEANSKIDLLQSNVDGLKILIEQLMESQITIEGWITEKEAIRLTGLSRGTLFKLRKTGDLSSSTLSGKQNFYRISDFKKLLEINEQKR